MKKFNLSKLVILILIGIILSGCGAVTYTGDIIKSGQKSFDAVYTPGITKMDIIALNNPVMAVNGIGSNGQVIIGYFGAGSTNSNVYSDMFIMELMKKGIIVSSLTQGTEDAVKNQNFKTLDSAGNQMVIIINTNLATSTSITEATLGGEYGKIGVTSFTIKGIRTVDNKVLFMGSGTYGKAKESSDVSKHIAFIIDNIYKGNLQEIKNY